MNRKLTREEKNTVKEIIKKYNSCFSDDMKSIGKVSAETATAGLVVGTVLDVIFLGGFGTVVLTTMGIMGAAPSAIYLLLPVLEKKVVAGTAEPQAITANTRVFLTLVKMNRHLHNEYQKTFDTKDPDELAKFVQIAEEFKADIKKLSPAFNATAGDGRRIAAEELKFSVARETDKPDSPRVSLDDEIIHIRKRIDTLRENPSAEDMPPAPVKKRLKLQW